MNKDGKLMLEDENGEIKEYSALVTFDVEARNKSYVIFTDYSMTDEGYLRIYYASYDKTGKDDCLREVTEPDEKEMLDNYVKKLESDLKSGTY